MLHSNGHNFELPDFLIVASSAITLQVCRASGASAGPTAPHRLRSRHWPIAHEPPRTPFSINETTRLSAFIGKKASENCTMLVWPCWKALGLTSELGKSSEVRRQLLFYIIFSDCIRNLVFACSMDSKYASNHCPLNAVSEHVVASTMIISSVARQVSAQRRT